jgi:hypothetical protein
LFKHAAGVVDEIVVGEIITFVVVDAVEIISNGVALVDIIMVAVEDAVFEYQGYFVELIEPFEILEETNLLLLCSDYHCFQCLKYKSHLKIASDKNSLKSYFVSFH